MHDATREALGYAENKSREDLDRDSMLFRALVKCIEIIGEAASRIGSETKQTTTTIPWGKINGMRNRLIHAYFDINKDLVWGTVMRDLPTLDRELTIILGKNPNN